MIGDGPHALARGEVQKWLGRPVTDSTWEVVIHSGDAEDYARNRTQGATQGALRRLVHRTQDAEVLLRRIGAQRSPEEARREYELQDQDTEDALPASRRALSSATDLTPLAEFVADEASRDAAVQHFRQSQLEDGLLAWERMEAWILEQAERDGYPTWWLSELPVPRTYVIDELLEGSTSRVQPLRLEIGARQVNEVTTFRRLAYTVPPDAAMREIPTADGVLEPDTEEQRTSVAHDSTLGAMDRPHKSILEPLRRLSSRLALEYGWGEAEATTFVLTGKMPQLRAIATTWEFRDLPALPRVILTVDPFASRDEVAEHYERVRNEIIGDRPRHRDALTKQLRLATFAATRPPLSKGETWAKRMDDWNQQVDTAAWRFAHTSNFQRDYQRAEWWLRWLRRATYQRPDIEQAPAGTEVMLSDGRSVIKGRRRRPALAPHSVLSIACHFGKHADCAHRADGACACSCHVSEEKPTRPA